MKSQVHPIPSTAPKAPVASKRDAGSKSVPAPQLKVESVSQVNLAAIGDALATAASYYANVANRKPTKAEIADFGSPAVEKSIVARLETGFNEEPRFFGVNGPETIAPPPVGTAINESLFKATAAVLKAATGAPKVLTGNAVVLTALEIAKRAWPGEPIAIGTVAKIAAVLCAPKDSTAYRVSPERFYGTSGGDNYVGTSRARGFLKVVDGEIK